MFKIDDTLHMLTHVCIQMFQIKCVLRLEQLHLNTFNCVSLLAEGVLWILGCAIACLGQGRGAIGKLSWGGLVWDWAGCG